MWPLPSLAFALLTAPVADGYPRQPIDVVDYHFALELADTTNSIVGRATIDLRTTAAGLEVLWLDLVSAAAGPTGMRVGRVTVAGQAVAFQHQGSRLAIPLTRPAAGQRLLVTVEYAGVPSTGLLIGNNRHGERAFFSDNWPDKARHWLPVIDHIGDKATSTFAVTAPAHYQVISNGLVTETTDVAGNRRRTVWRQSVPIAPWLFALGVARFAVQHVGWHRGAAVSTWVFAPDRDAGFFDFAVPTLDALAFFHERIGPFAYEKLANVQSNSVAGGMEAASSVFYSEGSVTGTRSERWRNVIIHEVAHQWWGNSVTERDWDDVWLSEGFATYFTMLFIEHAYGRDQFVQELEKSRRSVLEFDARNPQYRIIHDRLEDMSKVTTRQTYEKGAWTLHMLRSMIETEAFWRGIQDYYSRYRDSHASTTEFREVMERAAGQPLGWFFDQWLTRGGFPSIRGSWHYDGPSKALVIELSQTQPGQPFRLPIDVSIRLADGTQRIERVTLQAATHQFRFAISGPPGAVALDPNVTALFSGGLTAR